MAKAEKLFQSIHTFLRVCHLQLCYCCNYSCHRGATLNPAMGNHLPLRQSVRSTHTPRQLSAAAEERHTFRHTCKGLYIDATFLYTHQTSHPYRYGHLTDNQLNNLRTTAAFGIKIPLICCVALPISPCAMIATPTPDPGCLDS